MSNATQCQKKSVLWILGPTQFFFTWWKESGVVGMQVENRLKIVEAETGNIDNLYEGGVFTPTELCCKMAWAQF